MSTGILALFPVPEEDAAARPFPEWSQSHVISHCCRLVTQTQRCVVVCRLQRTRTPGTRGAPNRKTHFAWMRAVRSRVSPLSGWNDIDNFDLLWPKAPHLRASMFFTRWFSNTQAGTQDFDMVTAMTHLVVQTVRRFLHCARQNNLGEEFALFTLPCRILCVCHNLWIFRKINMVTDRLLWVRRNCFKV